MNEGKAVPVFSMSATCSNKQQQETTKRMEQSEDLLYWQESWQEACIKNFARENIFVLFHSFQYLFRQVLPFVLCRNDVIHTLKISNIYTLTNSGFLSTNSFFFCIILTGSNFIGKATVDISAPWSRSQYNYILQRHFVESMLEKVLNIINISCRQPTVGSITIISMPK